MAVNLLGVGDNFWGAGRSRILDVSVALMTDSNCTSMPPPLGAIAAPLYADSSGFSDGTTSDLQVNEKPGAKIGTGLPVTLGVYFLPCSSPWAFTASSEWPLAWMT
jgi:hypothetical protein